MMDVQKLQMDKQQARDLYLKYQQARAGMTPNDRAISAIYKRIAAGKLVIRALASITAAGLGEDKLPKLAIMRADIQRVQCYPRRDQVELSAVIGNRQSSYAKDRHFTIDMPGCVDNWHGRKIATVPLIPVHLRPRRAIEKYHILWEADWNQYPVDPYLLRRFGADAWVVVAAWDLTPVERAVMAQQLNA